MTVPANVSRWQYDGNGSATSFAYTGKVFAKTDLVVTRTSAAGADTLLVVDVDYTVSGVGLEAGGDVLYPIVGSPLPVGERLTIQRIVPLTQLLDLRNQGGWFPENHEDAYDRLTMIAHQHDDALLRALRFPPTDPAALSGIMPTAVTRALKLLGFDSDGNPIATSGSLTGAIVSVFMETLLDDANAAAALTTLGVSAYIQTVLNDADAATARATLDALENVFTTRGDIVRAGVAAVPQRLALGPAESVLMSNEGDPVWHFPVPTGYRHGLEISRVAAYDVSIAVGVAKGASGVWTIRPAAPIVKQLDATWVVGTNQGGRPAAVALTADTWYHVFVIFNTTGALVDAGFDTSPVAANLLAASGYNHYRRIGSVLTNSGPTDILDFFQSGPWFWWQAPGILAVVAFGGAGTQTPGVPVPPDVKPGALLTVGIEGGADVLCYVSSPDQADVAPSDTGSALQTIRASNQVADPSFTEIGPLRVSTTRTIRVRVDAAVNVRLVCRGWYDPLP